VPTLILVDGFAGTGKSTAAQRLWLDFTRAGRNARWFHEHERAHPIVQYGEVEELLREPVARFERKLLAAWTRVADAAGPAGAAPEQDALIIEGALVQIPVGVMMAMGAPPARIRAVLREIAVMLDAADASLVYLFHPDVPKSLQRTGALRGPQWLVEMIATLGAAPYGRRHGVKDVRGLAAFYERQREVVESVLPRVPLRRLLLDASGRQWAGRQRRIARFAGVPSSAEPVLASDALLNHAGAYRSPAGLPATITTDGRRLYAQLPATRALPLIPVRDGEGHFCAESLPIDFRFTYDPRGRARRFTYESRMANEVLTQTSWARA
jgi:hypothetical protein